MIKILTLYEKNKVISISGIYTAFLSDYKNGFLFSGETHDFWEMMYCINGCATVTAGDRVMALGENQCIFFRPNEFHSFLVEKNTPSRFFITSFKGEGEYTQNLGGKIFYLDRGLKGQLFDMLEIHSPELGGTGDILTEQNVLGKLSYRKGDIDRFINSLESFLITLSGESAVKTDIPDSGETRIYTDALRWIDRRITERMTVEELSRLCNVSPSYLKKLFGKYNGLGIHEYILKNKLTIARQMLTSGNTVTEVATELGFSSQNYFSTVFKREIGVSPTEYRKNSL